MGIQNIHILMDPEPAKTAKQAQVSFSEKLLAEHRRGMHAWGSMRRGCPLCQASK